MSRLVNALLIKATNYVSNKSQNILDLVYILRTCESERIILENAETDIPTHCS